MNEVDPSSSNFEVNLLSDLFQGTDAESELKYLLALLDMGIDHWRLRLEIVRAFYSCHVKYHSQGREMIKTIPRDRLRAFSGDEVGEKYEYVQYLAEHIDQI